MTIVRSLGGVFCDDIRQEVNGKVSLIGCYANEMLVAEIPTVLPKLCAQARLITSQTHPFKSVKFLVYKDDELIITGDIPELPEPQGEVSEDKLLAIYSQFVLTSLEISSPCIIRIRAEVDGQLVRGLGLIVRLPTDDERVRFSLAPMPTEQEKIRESRTN